MPYYYYNTTQLHSGSLTDAIYMAPARDENSLYAQFNEIKIKELLRPSIRYAAIVYM